MNVSTQIDCKSHRIDHFQSDTLRINWLSLTKKSYMPPYCLTIAQMLRTPSPCPASAVTGIPWLNTTSASQELIICKNLPVFFTHKNLNHTGQAFFLLLLTGVQCILQCIT